MRTVIITGCAGLLGSHFSNHLLDRGYRVVGIDDLSGGYADYLPQAPRDIFEFCPLDLSEGRYAENFLEHIFEKEKPAACFHFAAYAAEGLSPFIRTYNYRNNVLASANVINNCINHDTKLIFTSSMAVYGGNTAPFDESMVPNPIDPYGVAKYAVEMDIKIAGEQHGLPYNIVRPHNIVGIFQNIWDRYRNVVGIFIRRILDNEPVLIYGDGEQTRAFSDVQYYMDPFEKLIDHHGGETFNLGADQHYSINELANKVISVAEKYGRSGRREYREPRHEVKDAYCNHDKAKEWLGFKDETSLTETIDKMFVWAMNEPKRPQRNMRYEVSKGIYDYWK